MRVKATENDLNAQKATPQKLGDVECEQNFSRIYKALGAWAEKIIGLKSFFFFLFVLFRFLYIFLLYFNFEISVSNFAQEGLHARYKGNHKG